MENFFGKKVFDFYINRYQKMAGVGPPASYPSLREMTETLMQFPDEVFNLYGFNSEPMKRRVRPQLRDELLTRCTEEGQAYARELKQDYPGRTPLEIAKCLGITVRFPFRPTNSGGQVRFAEFEEPNQIRVFQDTLNHAQTAINDYGLQDLFENISIENVLTAHELFHYVESKYRDTIFSLNYKFELWHILSYHYTTKLVSLREISAMAFAKELNDLPFSPYLFDVFLSYTYNPDAGGSLYNEICMIKDDLEANGDIKEVPDEGTNN